MVPPSESQNEHFWPSHPITSNLGQIAKENLQKKKKVAFSGLVSKHTLLNNLVFWALLTQIKTAAIKGSPPGVEERRAAIRR